MGNRDIVREALAAVKPRTFIVHETRTIDFQQVLTEERAREFFPDINWDDPEVSQAGQIEEHILEHGLPTELELEFQESDSKFTAYEE